MNILVSVIKPILPESLIERITGANGVYSARALFSWLNDHPEHLETLIPDAMAVHDAEKEDTE